MADLTIWDVDDIEEGREPPSGVRVYVDGGELFIEWVTDDIVRLTPESARVLAAALVVLSGEVEAGA